MSTKNEPIQGATQAESAPELPPVPYATHPYVAFKIIPNPPSRVSVEVDETQLDKALDRHLATVSKRNKTLTPADIYERVILQAPARG